MSHTVSVGKLCLSTTSWGIMTSCPRTRCPRMFFNRCGQSGTKNSLLPVKKVHNYIRTEKKDTAQKGYSWCLQTCSTWVWARCHHSSMSCSHDTTKAPYRLVSRAHICYYGVNEQANGFTPLNEVEQKAFHGLGMERRAYKVQIV